MIARLSIAGMNSARLENLFPPAERSQRGNRRLHHVGVIASA